MSALMAAGQRRGSICPPIPQLGMESPTLEGDHPSSHSKDDVNVPPMHIINDITGTGDEQEVPVQAVGQSNHRNRMRRMSMEVIGQLTQVASSVRRVVGMGQESAPVSPVGSPRMRQGASFRGRAVGGPIHAFLTMVPGGTGDSITRLQYKDLLESDMKRLKLNSIRIPIDNIVDAVFEDHQTLGLEMFEKVVSKINLPTGKLASVCKPAARNVPLAEVGRSASFLHRDRELENKTAWGKIKNTARRFLDDNGSKLCAAIYALVNLLLFIQVIASRNGWLPGSNPQRIGAAEGALVDLARAFGMLCNFNCSFVIVPMMRTFITNLQSTWVVNYVPLDKAYDFHQVVAFWAFVFGCSHGTFHVLNLIMWTEWSFDGALWCGTKEDAFMRCSAVTGILVLLTMTIIVGFSHSYFRKSEHFNTFWLMHHTVPIFYLLLIFHCHDFWKWLLPSLAGYLIDRLYRRRKAAFVSKVIKTSHKDQGVLQIQFSKPWSINSVPGQYVFLKCPSISKFEYHPFTLTSSPEDDYFECHIKAVGDWTRDAFREYSPSNIEDGRPVYLQSRMDVYVDGPFGAPSQDWIQYETIVLISAGIGVTPFASILKYLRDRIRQRNALIAAGLKVPRCLDLLVTKVYFYWICRDAEAFQWFTEVIADTQKELGDMLEVHVYLSSMNALGDVRAVMTHIGLHCYFLQHKVDAITSLTSRTHYDRPNWSQIFKGLVAEHKNERVGVFFCGPHSLGVTLGRQCSECSTAVTSLVFSKENF